MEYIGLEFVPIEKLKVAPTNVREIEPPREKLQETLETIKACGVIEPLIVNENYEIVSGSIRYRLALAAGLKELPVIKCRFKDKVEEMAVCLFQDVYRHPLELVEKGKFVQKCADMGIRINELCERFGFSKSTLYAWWDAIKIPEPLRKESFLETYSKMTKKKQEIARKLAKQPVLQPQLPDIIEFGAKAHLRDFENVAKEVKRGLPVDFKARLKRLEIEHELYNLRIPKPLFEEMTAILKAKNIDVESFILFAIRRALEDLKVGKVEVSSLRVQA